MGGAAVISARAKAEVELIEVPAHTFRRVLAEMPSVSETIVRAFMVRRERLEAGVHGFIGLQVLGEADSQEVFHLHDFLSRNHIPAPVHRCYGGQRGWQSAFVSASAWKRNICLP